MLFVMAILWGLPMSLVTCELSSAMPLNGGYTLWVDTAYGGFLGFQESFWSWLSCVADNALYPIISYDTIMALWHGNAIAGRVHSDDGAASVDVKEADPWLAYVSKLLIAIVYSLPVLFGRTEWVSQGMSVLAVLLLTPFCVMIPYILWDSSGKSPKAGGLDWSRLQDTRPPPVDWIGLLHVAFWNFNGFDCGSTCAGEVIDPGKSYPKGVLLAWVVVLFVTLIPLVVATAKNEPPWEEWKVGWWSAIAMDQAGYGFALSVVFSSLVGAFGMHSAVMWEDAWQLCGMAEAKLAPKFLAQRHPTLGTPTNATLVSMLLVCMFVALDFRSIVIIDNFFSVASGLLELAAFYELSVNHYESMERPYAIPWLGHRANSPWRVVCFLLPPVTLGATVLLTSFDDVWRSVLILIPLILLGFKLPSWLDRRSKIVTWDEHAVLSGAVTVLAEETVIESILQKPIPGDGSVDGGDNKLRAGSVHSVPQSLLHSPESRRRNKSLSGDQTSPATGPVPLVPISGSSSETDALLSSSSITPSRAATAQQQTSYGSLSLEGASSSTRLRLRDEGGGEGYRSSSRSNLQAQPSSEGEIPPHDQYLFKLSRAARMGSIFTSTKDVVFDEFGNEIQLEDAFDSSEDEAERVADENEDEEMVDATGNDDEERSYDGRLAPASSSSAPRKRVSRNDEEDP